MAHNDPFTIFAGCFNGLFKNAFMKTTGRTLKI
jgi:hypothetical protein